jgi:glycosyltransferase involved in cell wall biosynthesis
MKRITWLTPTFFLDVDALIVPELSKTFKIVWIICGNRESDEYLELKAKTKSEDLSVEFYQLRAKWYSPFSYVETRNLYQYLIDKQSDIIYIDNAPQLFSYIAAIRALPIARTVFATHNVKTPKGARHEKLARYYMVRLLKHFQNFQTFSKNQRDYLNTLVKGKNVLYAPLTLKDYGIAGTRTSDSKINFLSFGHIRNYKRIDLLIEAAQMLYEETGVEFKVTIAGHCTNWQEYAGLIKYPQLFDLKIGFIKDRDIPELFANADYLVLPYQDLAQSGAITVAFNYNIPVITSDIPQFKEFVTDNVNGFLFTSESAIDLKNIMAKVLDFSSEKYQELVYSTTEYVKQNYSLSAIANLYINYFNQL